MWGGGGSLSMVHPVIPHPDTTNNTFFTVFLYRFQTQFRIEFYTSSNIIRQMYYFSQKKKKNDSLFAQKCLLVIKYRTGPGE